MTQQQTFDEAKRALAYSFENRTSLCAPFLSVIPVSGASVSFLASTTAQSTICASDQTAARLDELQFDLGEGPCWQAMRTRRPVLQPNIQSETFSAWPEFWRTISGGEVGAMFAFPLHVNSLEIGAVELYSSNPGPLTTTQVAHASALADITAWQVLRRVLADLDEEPELRAHSRREVHQATGMVIAQLDVTADDATLLLRAHAFSTGRSVREIANDVVERRLNFSGGDTPSPHWGER
jgi:GAF domain-containing protein